MVRKLLSVDGTYPYDHYGKWRQVRNHLPLQEAAQLVGAQVTAEEIEEHETSRWGSCYLWLNKGFIVIGRREPTKASAGESMNLAMMEMLGSGPERKGIKVGDQAVYLHDGTYSLIERVAP